MRLLEPQLQPIVGGQFLIAFRTFVPFVPLVRVSGCANPWGNRPVQGVDSW